MTRTKPTLIPCTCPDSPDEEFGVWVTVHDASGRFYQFGGSGSDAECAVDDAENHAADYFGDNEFSIGDWEPA